jgi:hypothetical protein
MHQPNPNSDNLNLSAAEQEAFLDRLIDDEEFRHAITTESLFWFMRCYLPRHTWIGTAEFQKEIMELFQRDIPGVTTIAAFREAGKSSLLRGYIIHQIVTGARHFVLIGSKTERQAQDHSKSIRREFEDLTNLILQNDLGPFREESDEWGKSIVIPRYDCKISAVSVEQTVRGIHYRQYRPDLVILDDIEDLASVKSKEATDKIHDWLERDVIPAAAQTARFVMVGNLLTDNSILTRVRKDIENGKRDGIFRSYPLVDENGIVAWPEKFPTHESLEQEKRRHTELAWKQEYLLLPVTDSEPVIRKEWLKFYHEIPKFDSYPPHRLRLISVDPATSERAQADCTAIVCADIFGYGEERKIYIRRNPINQRGLSVKETVDLVKRFYNEAMSIGNRVEVVVETVGMQSVYLEMIETAGILRVHGFRPGADKRERLSLAGYPVQIGQVYFPDDEEGGPLLRQILNFGSGHDDLADAFSMLILQLTEMDAGGTVTFPRPYSMIETPNLKDPDIRKSEELKADQALIAESNHERSGGTWRPGNDQSRSGGSFTW